MTGRDAPASASPAGTPGWAVFLACSWTWCIGMYLPLVLRDHYGWAAVAAFALPNLAGIVLFAFAFPAVESSRAAIARHGGAMSWFSLLTIAFHVYFLAAVWRYEFSDVPAALAMLIPLPVVALAWAARALSDRAIVRTAIAVYGISMAMTAASAMLLLNDAAPARAAFWAQRDPSGLVFLAPLFCLGFLLCPAMDLTFHRALRSVGGGSAGRRTFALFAAAFAIMLLHTVIYSQTGLRWPAIMHILLQSWFTMAVHWREIEVSRARAADSGAAPRLWAVLFIAWMLVLVPIVDYRWWFIFTGLVFPAWVVLMLVRPRSGRPAAPEWAAAVTITSLTPFAAMGFLAGFEWLLLVPCVALIIAPFVGRGAAAESDQAQGGAGASTQPGKA